MEVILQAEVLKGRDPGSKLSQPHHHSKVPANCIVDTGVLDLHHNWCSLRKGALRRHPSAQSSPVHLSNRSGRQRLLLKGIKQLRDGHPQRALHNLLGVPERVLGGTALQHLQLLTHVCGEEVVTAGSPLPPLDEGRPAALEGPAEPVHPHGPEGVVAKEERRRKEHRPKQGGEEHHSTHHPGQFEGSQQKLLDAAGRGGVPHHQLLLGPLRCGLGLKGAVHPKAVGHPLDALPAKLIHSHRHHLLPMTAKGVDSIDDGHTCIGAGPEGP
mmetsp:Transcript_17879/g.50052  ORF Transcript_17879/g.50052 Transcript_17879/m.50052 type:complete len:270 (-) Transcript_17879:795-1604(-)